MSGKIPREFIDDVLARTDIVEVIGARISLSKGGRDLKGCCPFHNEKTPSFTVSQTKQFYHCFGCGANGSAIGFLMDFDQLSFREAIEDLAESAGLELPDTGIFRPHRVLHIRNDAIFKGIHDLKGRKRCGGEVRDFSEPSFAKDFVLRDVSFLVSLPLRQHAF